METSDNQNDKKCSWFLRPFGVWVMILSVGPLALPFLILSPKFSKPAKIIISLLLIILTVYSVYTIYQLIVIFNDPGQLDEILKKYLTGEQLQMVNEMFMLL